MALLRKAFQQLNQLKKEKKKGRKGPAEGVLMLWARPLPRVSLLTVSRKPSLDWRVRDPALQAQSLEFKSQSHKKPSWP
jgi:hypothetical protein